MNSKAQSHVARENKVALNRSDSEDGLEAIVPQALIFYSVNDDKYRRRHGYFQRVSND